MSSTWSFTPWGRHPNDKTDLNRIDDTAQAFSAPKEKLGFFNRYGGYVFAAVGITSLALLVLGAGILPALVTGIFISGFYLGLKINLFQTTIDWIEARLESQEQEEDKNSKRTTYANIYKKYPVKYSETTRSFHCAHALKNLESAPSYKIESDEMRNLSVELKEKAKQLSERFSTPQLGWWSFLTRKKATSVLQAQTAAPIKGMA